MHWTLVGRLVSSLAVLHTKKEEDEEHLGKLIFTPGVWITRPRFAAQGTNARPLPFLFLPSLPHPPNEPPYSGSS